MFSSTWYTLSNESKFIFFPLGKFLEFLEVSLLIFFFSPCRRRQANLLKGKQLLREGKVSEARECFTRSINITHVMAHKVIKVSPIGNEAKENKWPTSSKLVMSCILMGEQENEGREITLGLTQGSGRSQEEEAGSFDREESNGLQGEKS